MAFRSAISSKIPMVIILGATGTGKTKLSVELAQKFGTEIISADSMQIYKGLDVVTAKATKEERKAAPHHLLDILEPHQMFTVVDFRDRALKIIDQLTEQGKIPIIVGGTNYYIESIVYKILVQKIDDTDDLLWNKSRRKRDFDEDVEGSAPKRLATEMKKDDLYEGSCSETVDKAKGLDQSDDKTVDNSELNDTIISKEEIQRLVDEESKYTNKEIHAKLEVIDPIMANRLHHNNRRKVLRSIEYWLQTGRRHSEVLDEQKESEGQLRRPGATIIFWLRCEQSVHEKRLDDRVDGMLKDGLIEELLDFHDRHNRHRIKDGSPADYTKGIFQTLGFKEFHEYLMMSEEQRNSEEGRKLLEQSIDNMKLATRRFARRQNKMVRGRFLEHPRREVPPIYELDTTDLSNWNTEVRNKAITIIESHIKGISCEYQPVKTKLDDVKKNLNSSSKNYCEVCQRVIIGDKEYATHMASNRHKKVLKKRERESQKIIKEKAKSTSDEK